MHLIQKLEKTIKEKKLLKKGDSFVIGVSGGVDSISLLYALVELSKEWDFLISVAHLNHGVRNDSIKDEKFVEKLSKKYGLPYYSKKVSLPKSNIEQAGRTERYIFFKEVKKESKSKYIITAHNLNDNIETIILNLTRGSGLNGLSGMELKENRLIRPFLNLEKEEIENFAEKNNLKWREDPSNKSLKYSRNRLRHKVIPELSKINEKALSNIERSANIVNEANIYIKNEVAKYLEKNLNNKKELNIEKFSNLSTFLQKEVLLGFLSRVSILKDIEMIHIKDIVKITKKGGTKEIHLPSGLILVKEYDKLKLVRSMGKKEKEKETNKQELRPETETTFSNYILTNKSIKKLEKSTKKSVFLDIEKIGKLFVRSRKDGDRIRYSTNKSKKIKDLFIDLKVPKQKRTTYPIIVNGEDQVVWVPNIRQDIRFKADSKTNKILNLKVKNEKK